MGTHELAVDVAANSDGAVDWLDVAFVEEDLPRLIAETLDIGLGELLALTEVGDPLVLLANVDHGVCAGCKSGAPSGDGGAVGMASARGREQGRAAAEPPGCAGHAEHTHWRRARSRQRVHAHAGLPELVNARQP